MENNKSEQLEWINTTWGSIVELKYGKALSNYGNSDDETPVFGTNGPIGFTNSALCQHAGIIVGRKGAYRGIHFSDKPFYVIDTAFYINPLIDINLKWAYYHLLTQDINSLDSGSAIPSTRKEDFYALPVKVPPRIKQDLIANYLEIFDKKIQLNNQINKTLEQITQTLFKSWFVDFDPMIDNALDAGNSIPEALQSRAELRQKTRNSADFKPLPADIRALFPAEFEETELGWIPKGWKEVRLSLLSKITSGKRPPSKFSEPSSLNNVPVWGGNGIKWFTSKHLYNERYIITGRVGTLGTFYKVNGLSWPSDNALVIQPVNHEFYDFIYQSLQTKDILSLNAGSTQPLLTQTTLGNITFIIPQDSMLLVKFQSICDSFQKKISANKISIDLNTDLRDTQLPKLISGELSLEDLPDLVDQTEPA
ncbi:restriction endonuclease subunit S [Phytobacter ursingii]